MKISRKRVKDDWQRLLSLIWSLVTVLNLKKKKFARRIYVGGSRDLDLKSALYLPWFAEALTDPVLDRRELSSLRLWSRVLSKDLSQIYRFRVHWNLSLDDPLSLLECSPFVSLCIFKIESNWSSVTFPINYKPIPSTWFRN